MLQRKDSRYNNNSKETLILKNKNKSKDTIPGLNLPINYQQKLVPRSN